MNSRPRPLGARPVAPQGWLAEHHTEAEGDHGRYSNG
jgi:hypothetical protein